MAVVLVENLPSFRGCQVGVAEKREIEPKPGRKDRVFFRRINTHSDQLDVSRIEQGLVASQLDQLLIAGGSPVASVEHHHNCI